MSLADIGAWQVSDVINLAAVIAAGIVGLCLFTRWLRGLK